MKKIVISDTTLCKDSGAYTFKEKIEIARLLEDYADFFGVSSVSEALELRQAGIQTPILILGHTRIAAFPEAVRENIRPTIYRWEDALALSEAARHVAVMARAAKENMDLGMEQFKGYDPLRTLEINEPEENRHYLAVKALADAEGSQLLPICAKLEADIAELDDEEEKAMFMEDGIRILIEDIIEIVLN